MKPSICTYTGVEFNIFEPRVENVRIKDIAHALSNNCRWGGHSEHFYSVAQHSWDVSLRVPARDAGRALLHDAAEAYMVDVPSPIKQHLCFLNPLTGEVESYKKRESAVLAVIFRRFGIGNPDGILIPLSVERADAAAADCERASLIPETEWYPMKVPPREMSPQPPHRAKQLFLERFYALVDTGVLKDPTK